MNYIVNPAIFYWMSVMDCSKLLIAVAFIVSLIGLIIFIFVYAFYNDVWDEDEANTAKRMFKYIALVLIISSVGIVFIPSKTTMIEMLIAKTATIENAELTVDAIKEIVDYIVEAMKTI